MKQPVSRTRYRRQLCGPLSISRVKLDIGNNIPLPSFQTPVTRDFYFMSTTTAGSRHVVNQPMMDRWPSVTVTPCISCSDYDGLLDHDNSCTDNPVAADWRYTSYSTPPHQGTFRSLNNCTPSPESYDHRKYPGGRSIIPPGVEAHFDQISTRTRFTGQKIHLKGPHQYIFVPS